MTEIYLSKINLEDVDTDIPGELAALQASVTELGLTHVKNTKGEVWKIWPKLNKKSVGINSARAGAPSRIPFARVVSLGVMEPVETEGGTLAHVAANGAMLTNLQREQSEPEPEPTGSHQERAHAVLSASGAHRWLNCPPSAKLEAEKPDRASDAADQGTAAHELAEHKLRKALKERSERPTSHWQDDEMEEHTDNYRDFVLDHLEQAGEGAELLLEQRLDFSHLVEDGFGTGDALIVADKRLTVIDLKYGQGVQVDAHDNPQMKLYALGALALFDMLYDIDEVEMIIYQPRRSNISREVITVEELGEWAESVLVPAAKLAAAGEGEFSAGEWCQFCKIKNTCRARSEKALEIAQWEFEPVHELSDEEIAEAMKLVDVAKAWISDLEKYTLAKATGEGKKWPGFKLVAGRSLRKYSDPVAVAKAAEAAGYKDIFDKKLIGISAMQKLMGKSTFDEVLGDLVVKPEGKPTLVPVSDKRPEITVNTAEDDFEVLEETA